jgi:hypothetical protein
MPGHELSGVVAELGYGTTGLTVGQRVVGLIDWTRDGSLAEYTAVEARNLAPLPADVEHTRVLQRHRRRACGCSPEPAVALARRALAEGIELSVCAPSNQPRRATPDECRPPISSVALVPGRTIAADDRVGMHGDPVLAQVREGHIERRTGAPSSSSSKRTAPGSRTFAIARSAPAREDEGIVRARAVVSGCASSWSCLP